MHHPLLGSNHKDLRKNVLELLRSGYTIRRSDNIVFVCGGNDPSHMRERFRIYCETDHSELDVFKPEYALPSYFSNPVYFAFDITKFEQLIGDLSHAIVIFPEAAGSYAETGYFAAKPSLAKKTILVLDTKYQGLDSFISMGPAKIFDSRSAFNSSIQISYDNPNFSDVISRIKRIPISKTRKNFEFTNFKIMSSYELFALIYQIVSLLRIATSDDIFYILSGLFNTHFSKPKSLQILSILVGSGYLMQIGDFGQYTVNANKKPLLSVRHGLATNEASIRLNIAVLLSPQDSVSLDLGSQTKC